MKFLGGHVLFGKILMERQDGMSFRSDVARDFVEVESGIMSVSA